MKLPVTQEVQETRNLASRVISKASSVVVNDSDGYQKAGEVLKEIVALKKQVKLRKEKFTKPARDIIAQAKELFGQLEATAGEAEKMVKQAMLDWQQRLEAENAKLTQRLEGRVERGTMKLETAVKKASELPTVDTSLAGVTKTTIRKIKIVNPDLVPKQYWVIDETAVRRDALGNRAQGIAPIDIPGVEIIEESTLAMR